MLPFGKLLMLLGAVLLVLGVLVAFFDKIPLVGKLPGDIHIKREGFQLYVPITSSLLVSLLLNLLLWAVSTITKK